MIVLAFMVLMLRGGRTLNGNSKICHRACCEKFCEYVKLRDGREYMTELKIFDRANVTELKMCGRCQSLRDLFQSETQRLCRKEIGNAGEERHWPLREEDVRRDALKEVQYS